MHCAVLPWKSRRHDVSALPYTTAVAVHALYKKGPAQRKKFKKEKKKRRRSRNDRKKIKNKRDGLFWGGAEGEAAASFSSVATHEAVQLITMLQLHGLRLLLQSIVAVQLPKVGQVRFYRGWGGGGIQFEGSEWFHFQTDKQNCHTCIRVE